eukprot:6670850-Prymnesium_polylepis.1
MSPVALTVVARIVARLQICAVSFTQVPGRLRGDYSVRRTGHRSVTLTRPARGRASRSRVSALGHGLARGCRMRCAMADACVVCVSTWHVRRGPALGDQDLAIS